MDDVISDLRFLRKIMLTPTTDNRIDIFSSDMDTDLYGMDILTFHRKREEFELRRIQTWPKESIVFWCSGKVGRSLFNEDNRDDAYQNITEEQINVILEMMSFILLEDESLQVNVIALILLCS